MESKYEDNDRDEWGLRKPGLGIDEWSWKEWLIGLVGAIASLFVLYGLWAGTR